MEDPLRLPETAKQADTIVVRCLDEWEQGGRDELLTLLQTAFTRASQSTQASFSANAPFSLLLCAWMLQSILHRKVQPSQCSSLLVEIAPTVSISAEQTPQASSSRAPSVSAESVAEYAPSLFNDVILDSIWAVDAEIDARRELSALHELNQLASAATKPETLEEHVSEARKGLADIVVALMDKEVISKRLAAERLEVPLLTRIGLIADEKDFSRRSIRMNTARLYKQQKFNLLREENEGYSGLINELILGMGPRIIATYDDKQKPHVIEQENVHERNARAAKVMNNISALIGYFDLDPNRVLDVILDVFSSNVVHHWPFFLSLLSSSPWSQQKSDQDRWDEDGVDVDMDLDDNSLQDRFSSVDLDVSTDVGQATCAQLLGFKFRYYQHPETKQNTTPDDLYLTAALLIRHGQVKFSDLYSHLTPDEKGMTKLHERYKDELSEKAMSAKGNALSMAAPLTTEDDEGNTLTNSRDKSSKANTDAAPHVPPNQIVGLLRALLAVGQIKHALFILCRYPWLCGASPDVADLFCRILEVTIEPAYKAVALSTHFDALDELSAPTPRSRYDVKKQEMVQMPPRRLDITSAAPEPLLTTSTRFVYFYSLWAKSLPHFSTASSVLRDFVPLLRILGAHLSRRPSLMQKVCRIGKSALQTALSSTDVEGKEGWLEVVRNVLLPSLSMTSGNSGFVSEIWFILQQLPYTERYSLYGEWKYSLYRRPELRVRQAEVEKEAKGILKRISSDNVKLSGRSLAKASHANPIIFFAVALNQVQSYSNLIAPIVECAKYLTNFEYDIFGFSLIDALSNPEKDRTKQDGTSVSQWLQSLATFTGTLYWRYPMMDCSSVLQYIANQLKENNVKDLVIIRELVLKMTGIEPLANLSDSQVAALTGGRILSMEAMMMANAGLATPTRLHLRKSGARLLNALMESRMIMPLLILIAQQRQACIHLVPDNDAHLKYLGNLFDTCQEILFQYVEFLNNQLEPQAYSEIVPSFDDLCRRFELEPAIASHIVRPRLALKVRAAEAKATEERLRRELLASQAKKVPKAETQDTDVVKTEAVKGESDAQEVKEEDKVKESSDEDLEDDAKMEVVDHKSSGKDASEDATMKDEEEKVDADMRGEGEDHDVDESEEKVIWTSALAEAFEAAENALPDEAKRVIGIHFYATFWQLALSDIAVPSERYQQEIQSLQRVVDANREGSRGSNGRLRAEAQECMRKLRAEMKEQSLNHQATRRRLALEKGHWFPDDADRSEIVYALLQHCFIPRALLSPTDAVFAGRFLRSLHAHGTRNFASLMAYDKVFMELVPSLLFSTTENEARNLARFLHTLLLDITPWFKDQTKFAKDVQGDNLPGFQVRWGDRHGGEVIPDEDKVGFEQYKTVVRKWHNMLRSTFLECLVSHEYMRIRNSIVVMTRIANVFPMWGIHGDELMETISAVAKEEERGDLKVLGQGLLATLKKEEKSWIPNPNKAKAAQKEKASEKEKQTNGASVDSANASESRGGSSTAPQAGKDEHKAPTRPSTSASQSSQTRQSSTHKLPARPDVRSNTSSGRAARNEERTKTDSKAEQKEESDVRAARQAVLDSMRESSATSMNPPKAPSHRDRGSGRDTPSAGRGSREGNATPRSYSDRSRDPSPRVTDRPSGKGSTTSTTNAVSNGGNREQTSSNSRPSSEAPDRAPDRDIKQQQQQQQQGRREHDNVSVPARRDRGRDDRYESGGANRSDRPRDRDRDRDRLSDDRDRNRTSARSERESDRWDDDRSASRRDRRDNDGLQRDLLSRQPPQGPRATMDQRRTASDYGYRQDHQQRSRESGNARAPPSSSSAAGARSSDSASNQASPSVRASVASSVGRREDNARATDADTSTGTVSSPSGSRKRSLADRLSAAEMSRSNSSGGGGGGGGGEGGSRGNARASEATSSRDAEKRVNGRDESGEVAALSRENEPNKRARTSRGYDDERRPSASHESHRGDQSRGTTSTANTPTSADFGISIHGRGGTGGGSASGNGRRPGTDSYRPNDFGGGGRDRYPSSGSAAGGRDRGRDRDKRRRERRSGG